MISNDRVMFEVAEGLERANAIAQQAWSEKHLSVADARDLVMACRKAYTAALELENRAVAAAIVVKG